VKRRISGELLDATKADRRRQGREVLLDDLAEPLGPGVEDDGAALALAAGVSALVFGPDEGLLDREKRAALRREVKCLPPPLERLAELRHFQGLPWRDVAKALGISEKTARNYDKKLRALLQVKLRDDDDLPFGP
jgi:RNA polymerase sigma factor (sigma-70 family)